MSKEPASPTVNGSDREATEQGQAGANKEQREADTARQGPSHR